MIEEKQRLGIVVNGSLTEGIEIKLDRGRSVEDVKVGRYITIDGENMRFFGVITDVALACTDPNLSRTPPDVSNPYIASVVSGTIAYGVLSVEPMLIVEKDDVLGAQGPMPAKTVPPHFSVASMATDRDVQDVFGEEGDRRFWIGNPLDMETRLCLDIGSFVERSNGVFGKSGTGKTFLTRLLLIGILQHSRASNLVFDMHGEYGWKGTSESGNEVKGLKQLFSSKVAVFSLDESSSKRRGLTPDYLVRIGYDEIEPEDIQMLRQTWGLSEVAADAAYSLQRHYGPRTWLKAFIGLKGAAAVAELARDLGVNSSALAALYNRITGLSRFKFVDDSASHDSVGQILRYLDRGMHVVLEFGRYSSDLPAYILVANLITRRIYDEYAKKKEMALGDKGDEPRPLVITIEEAHKFLNQEVANKTIFGTIAREMRKYNVTLLVVDQRPSSIDREVMSQLGTKIACLLDNEQDVEAVLSGVSGSRKLRSVLARLESRQQALVYGHALPMPVVIETRSYGTAESYKELGFVEAAEMKAQVENDLEDLFGSHQQ